MLGKNSLSEQNEFYLKTRTKNEATSLDMHV